jgi:Spy/CpxP family protein refolding chaperone
MSKIKLLYGFIALLLLLNTGLLVVLLTQNQRQEHERPHHKRPKELIVKQLHLDTAQEAQFEESMHWHHTHIQKLDDSIRTVRKELYQLLQQSSTDEDRKNVLLEQFSALHRKVEQTHWQHFSELKQICRPDQLDNFAELTEQLMQLFPRGGRPPHPPKDE